MVDSMLDKVKKLEEKKKKLQFQEKIIKNREKKNYMKRFCEIGSLANKAGIDLLDNDLLLGAFIEIAEKKSNESAIKLWKEKSNQLKEKTDQMNATPLIVKFHSDPSQIEKCVLKELKFKWNKFRSEFYGYGSKSELETRLKNSSCKIEIVE